ncbi:MAG: FG-GAP-like repeat-containing protein [Candidatus Latescibacterota bacterium]|nr:FG-GAP-like repeat-containing protein [Candidatus Latescibacterota bacterium]
MNRPHFLPVITPTSLAESIIIVPDGGQGHGIDDISVRRLANACRCPVVAQCDVDSTIFKQAHVIACGHLASNSAIARLYNARACFVDTFFPGGDSYLVRSVRDPFGHGRNAIVAGASSRVGLGDALAVLAELVEAADGTLGRVCAQRIDGLAEPPRPGDIENLIRQDLATWEGGWVSSPFRSGKLRHYLWQHYLSDHEAWGALVAGIFVGSLAPWRRQRLECPEEYHDFFHLDQFIRLWDLIEDHPVYEGQREAVVELLTEFLRHLSGLFYLQEEINPDGLPRQNHVTFIGLNLSVGHEYLSRRHGVTEFAEMAERVGRIFAGQATCYKPNDDAGVGYAWHVPWHTHDYLLAQEDYTYLDDGHVADLCVMLAVTTDNLRSEVGYGDSSGFAAFESGGWRAHLWPLLASLWHRPDAVHLWVLNWLAEGKRPGLDHGLESWHASVIPAGSGFTVTDIEPAMPRELLGVTPLLLPAPVLRLIARTAPEPHRPVASARHFDKLSLRAGFASDQEYLLLEGIGTLCHGHEDTQAILRLTWKGRAWLADGDYIRAAPKFHNSVTVQRDGVGVLNSPGHGIVIPPLARLLEDGTDEQGGFVCSEVAGYNGVDWRRSLIWRPGRYIAVVDELCCRDPGEYDTRCLWRVVGDVSASLGRVCLQQGDEQLFVINADESMRQIKDTGVAWEGYPHHDGPIQVIHQKISGALDVGESIVYLHVFTPHEDVTVERRGPAIVEIADGEDHRIVGVHNGRLIHADSLASGMDAFNQIASCTHRSPPHRTGPATTTMPHPLWERSLPNRLTAMAAVEADDPRLLFADETSTLTLVDAVNGSDVWYAELSSPASVLKTCDIDGDGTAEIIVGTCDAHVVVLDGRTGAQRWRRPLRNLFSSQAPATTLCVADLDGDGTPEVLVGTAGWYVNVFSPDGAPSWAQWIRYHVITALAAADVDGDGKAEVIIGNNYSTPLTVHEHDGAFRWSTLEQVGSEGNATTPRRGVGLKCLRLTDLDDDGLPEVVYGTEDGWVYAVDAEDGSEIWQLNVVGSLMGLAISPDGVLAASEFGDVYTIGRDGVVRARWRVGDGITAVAGSCDQLVLAVDERLLLRVESSGVTARLRVQGEIHQMVAIGSEVFADLPDARIIAHRFD